MSDTVSSLKDFYRQTNYKQQNPTPPNAKTKCLPSFNEISKVVLNF